MHDRNARPPTSGSTPPATSEADPQPSHPTEEDGAPSLGAPDRNPREITPGVRRAFAPAWDDQPAAWRNAFGSNR